MHHTNKDLHMLTSTTSSAPATSAPSVGRIVHFHDEGGPYAAIVTAINHDDGSLELATFGRNSIYFQHRVLMAPATGPTPRCCWTWPPRS